MCVVLCVCADAYLFHGYRDNFYSLLMATPDNPTGPLNPPLLLSYPKESTWLQVRDWSHTCTRTHVHVTA